MFEHAAKQICASFNKAVRRVPEITALGTSSVRRHTELDVENHTWNQVFRAVYLIIHKLNVLNDKHIKTCEGLKYLKAVKTSK